MITISLAGIVSRPNILVDPRTNNLTGPTRQMGCPKINHDPAHQQGQNIQRQPANASPVRNKAMERAAFEEEQVNRIACWTGADVEAQEHAQSAIQGGIACQYLPLLEP